MSWSLIHLPDLYTNFVKYYSIQDDPIVVRHYDANNKLTCITIGHPLIVKKSKVIVTLESIMCYWTSSKNIQTLLKSFDPNIIKKYEIAQYINVKINIRKEKQAITLELVLSRMSINTNIRKLILGYFWLGKNCL